MGRKSQIPFWIIIIRNFINKKNNIIFLTELVSSIPKFNEHQIKPLMAPLIKSKKRDGV